MKGHQVPASCIACSAGTDERVRRRQSTRSQPVFLPPTVVFARTRNATSLAAPSPPGRSSLALTCQSYLVTTLLVVTIPIPFSTHLILTRLFFRGMALFAMTCCCTPKPRRFEDYLVLPSHVADQSSPPAGRSPGACLGSQPDLRQASQHHIVCRLSRSHANLEASSSSPATPL